MSHFVVAVVTDKLDGKLVEKALEPFSQNTRRDKVFAVKNRVLENAESVGVSIKTKNDYKTFTKNWYGDDVIFEENGDIYYFTNLNAKWDWWVPGGRWSGEFKTKTGECEDCMKIKDFDFSSDKELYEYYLRFWEIIVEKQPLQENEEEPFNLYKPEYYLEIYKTKTNFAEQMSTPPIAALVYKNKWYEQGKIGWFGASDSTYESIIEFQDLLKSVLTADENQEKFITFVDCHI